MNKRIFLENQNGGIRLVDRKDGTVLMTATSKNGERNNWVTEGQTAGAMANWLVEKEGMKIVEVIE